MPQLTCLAALKKMTSIMNLSRKELLNACEMLIKELGNDKAQAVLTGIVKARNIETIAGSSLKLEANTGMGDGKVDSSRPGKKMKKDFDFSKYRHKHVAFWVGYFGEKYNGLATASIKGENDRTVEWRLLEALKKIRLIDPDGDFETWSYSRCGRTDRGVSASGQVISMKVRCADGEKDMDYASMINNNLPEDIFVLAWAPVEGVTTENGKGEQLPFDARFSCRSRVYRYFFRNQSLDLAKMREACSKLEGEHDFRNFCKIDLNNARTFVRIIESCKIVEGACLHQNLSYVEIRGSAFLWHQIRLIMAVLFHVGAGLESPATVDNLLDIGNCPARPSFAMASDLPLVLYSCEYDPNKLKWQFSPRNVSRLNLLLNNRLGRDLIQCELTKTFLDILTQPVFPAAAENEILDHEEINIDSKRKRHKAFADRIRCKSVDEHQRDMNSKDEGKDDIEE